MASEIQNGGQFSMGCKKGKEKGCNFFLLNIITIALLHCVGVKNERKL
jgi:hypothetical protein